MKWVQKNNKSRKKNRIEPRAMFENVLNVMSSILTKANPKFGSELLCLKHNCLHDYMSI